MFDDTRLDDPDALAAADPVLRRLAESGARVRREVDATAAAVAALDVDTRPRAVVAVGPDARLLRAVLEPWCPVPFVAWSGPRLPGWAGALDLVVVLAPGGERDPGVTGAVSEAIRRGCTLLVACDEHSELADLAAGRDTTVLPVTTGDALPATVAVLRAVRRLGLGPEVDADGVADALDAVASASSPFLDLSQNPAKEIALGIGDDVPLLWGGSVLAARVARRVAESVRAATGRAAVADGADHLLPVLDGAAPRDLFADPFEDGPDLARPVLVVVDDGTDDADVRAQLGSLRAAAERGGVRVEVLTADHGSEMARYASLLTRGTYAAVYLGVGLQGPSSSM
ncbi:SIS domain-containing protein [Solicola sp. PLA-1-18]|uniref:SIS domain-containing protein n=1 Tax=Solicola sp. PLA-1-18 TaxID=3380532 RepID=UPI003B7CFBB1